MLRQRKGAHRTSISHKYTSCLVSLNCTQPLSLLQLLPQPVISNPAHRTDDSTASKNSLKMFTTTVTDDADTLRHLHLVGCPDLGSDNPSQSKDTEKLYSTNKAKPLTNGTSLLSNRKDTIPSTVVTDSRSKPTKDKRSQITRSANAKPLFKNADTSQATGETSLMSKIPAALATKAYWDKKQREERLSTAKPSHYGWAVENAFSVYPGMVSLASTRPNTCGHSFAPYPIEG